MTVPSIDISELNDIWNKAKHHVDLNREERPPIENLVLEGGGVKGFAYVGALEIMAENGMLQNIKRVAGSSAGGIAALLLALGCEPAEITRIMMQDLDMKALLDPRYAIDPSRIFNLGGMKVGLSDIFNLFDKKGLFKGDAFVEVVRKITHNQLAKKLKKAIKQRDQSIIREIKQSGKSQIDINRHIDNEYEKLLDKYYIDDLGTITFSQFEKIRNDFPELGLRELFITGTRLSNATLKVFSADSDPDMSIVDAVRITMSFPFAFEPVHYQGDYYADGGIASNYPMDIFNQERFLTHGRNDAKVNPCTLGLLIDSVEEIETRWGIAKDKKKKLKTLKFCKKIIQGLGYRFDDLRNAYSVNTIQIFDNKIKTLEFDLSQEKVDKLMASGRLALQQYVDHYMSDDTLYSHLPSYENIYQKYYAKQPQELIRIVEEDLWPCIQEINNFIKLLKKVDMSHEIAKLEFALKDFSQNDKDEQYGVYLQLDEMANELDNFTKETSTVAKRLRSYHIKKRNLIANIEEATGLHDKVRVEQYQKTLNEVLRKISIAEDHKQSIEHEKVVFKEAYAEIRKAIRPEIFLLIEQKQKLQLLVDEQVLAKLRATETVLQEHLDVALKALSAHKKDYPDPRHNENGENWLFECKERFRAEVYNSYVQNDSFNDIDASKLADDCSEIYSDLLQFGVIVVEAKSLAKHFIESQKLFARTKSHELLDMHDKSAYHHLRKRFFRQLLWRELEKLKIIDEADLIGFEQSGQFWEDAVNEYLRTDDSITQAYAEYLAKEKTIKHFSAIALRQKQQEYKTYKRETKDKLDLEYALSLRELGRRLRRGKWGNDIATTNYLDIKHNIANVDIVDGITYGKRQSEYSITSIKTKDSIRGRYKSFQKKFMPPPIEAHILTPKSTDLQNPVKKTKELIVLFNQPEKADSIDEFSLAMKYSFRRKKQFSQHKDEIIKKVIWSLRQMCEEGLQPDDAKIKLTITGEGFAAQDAQYLLAAVIDEIRKRPDLKELQRLKNIQLVLTDPVRVSESLAIKTAEALHELKAFKPELGIKGYNLIHQRQSGLFRRNKRLHNYLGQANILSKCSPEDATVIADFRDTHDSRHQHLIFSNQTQRLELEKALNEGKMFYSHLFFRQISLYAKKLRNISKFLCFEFIPKVVGFLATKIFSPPRFFKSMLSPLMRVVKHFKTKKQIVYDIPPWMSLLRENVQQKQDGRQEIKQLLLADDTIETKIDHFIDQSSPSKRLQRETKPPIENLVLEGGGTNSYAYLGAIAQLEKDNLLNNLQRIAGSSAGGMIGALFSLGYSASELKDLFINQVNLKDFLDEPYPFAGLDSLFQLNGMDVGLGGIVSLFQNKGLFKGDYFKQFIEKLIAVKLEKNLKKILFDELSLAERALLEKVPAFLPEKDRNKRIDDYLSLKLQDLLKQYSISDLKRVTFKQAQQLATVYPSLKIKELYLTGTRMSDASLKVFSADSEPNMSIADAVRITMSFPGAFVPVNYEDEFYVDGSIAGTYPIQIFDNEKYLSHGVNDAGANPCTLGLIVESKQDIEARWGIQPTGVDEIGFDTLIFKVMQGIHNRVRVLRDKYNVNSIQISDNLAEGNKYQGSAKINFNLSKPAKHKLYQNGVDALVFYKEQYHNAANQYSHLEQYTNLYEKYSAKSELELQRILEDEIEPILSDFSSIEASLHEQQVRLNGLLHQVQLRLATVPELSQIELHLSQRDAVRFQIECSIKKEQAIQQKLITIENELAAKQAARDRLLSPFQKNNKVPSDVRESVVVYDRELASLVQAKHYVNEQHLNLTNRLSQLHLQSEAHEIALSRYEVEIVESILSKQQTQAKLERIDRALEAKAEILQERSLILRALQDRGVKIAKYLYETTAPEIRSSPLLLSLANTKAGIAAQLSIDGLVLNDLMKYFPDHEWGYFNHNGLHHFYHKSRVDEIIQVTSTAQNRLLLSGHPIAKLSQLANMANTEAFDVQAETLSQAKDFMRALHLGGLDISRIRNIEIQGNAFANPQQIAAEIINLIPQPHKSRLNPYK